MIFICVIHLLDFISGLCTVLIAHLRHSSLSLRASLHVTLVGNIYLNLHEPCIYIFIFRRFVGKKCESFNVNYKKRNFNFHQGAKCFC